MKNTGPEILDEAIATILKGGNYYSNEVAIKLMEPPKKNYVEKDRVIRKSVSAEDNRLTKEKLRFYN